jgi:hypothetical protein
VAQQKNMGFNFVFTIKEKNEKTNSSPANNANMVLDALYFFDITNRGPRKMNGQALVMYLINLPA